MRRYYILLLLFCLCVPSYACRIVPTPPIRPIIIRPHRPILKPITVKKHHFVVNIKDGVATTTLESVFYNPNSRQLEGTYLFPLPKGASIAKFSMWIDGKEMPAELLNAKKARDLYISIVRRMIDPGLLEFVGRETFKMRIFPIPARGNKRIKLSYQQILPINGNLMRYVYPLTTVGNGRDDILGQLSFELNIASSIPIKSVFSPSHRVKVVKENNKATVSFSGNSVHPNKDFTLYISRSSRKVDLSFVPYRKRTGKGYFLLMLSPKVKLKAKEQNPKDVVFVFDTSGSMNGEKIEQARQALKYCLNSLSTDDNFNIVPFSTEARPYKDKLLKASKENIKDALEFVEEEIYARGGTNIEEALGYALEMAPKTGKRPYMVVFLTDGKPTIGMRDPNGILKKVKKAGSTNLRLFTFGVGDRLNTKLLDRLAEENRGAREYVGIKEDIEIKISSFFDKISSPVLSNIKIKFPSAQGMRITEVYPREFPDLFKGAQLTMLGRYSGDGDQAISLTGFVNGKKEEFVYEVSFPKKNSENEQIPRLWAVRKIGFLLDQIRLNGENQELKKEVVRLAKKFGVVTPYTSYLVLEDDARLARNGRRPQVIRQHGRAWRGIGNAREKKSLAKARSGIRSDSGRNAVETSQNFKAMKEAQVADYIKPQKSSTVHHKQKFIKKIDEKTFYLRNGIWYDSEYKEQKRKLRIKYLSKEYFALLQKKAMLGKFLAIGSQVVIVVDGNVYEIYN